MHLQLKYVCPSCNGHELAVKGEELVCISCNSRWPVADGIADMGGDIPYYGEVPRERMQSIVREAKEKGWKRTLVDHFFVSYNFLYQIAAYETRADWLYMLDLGRQDLVLDVGSGWGTEAVPLAKNTGMVVALDGTIERLQFVMARAGQEKAENVVGVRGSILAPPLAPEQFDLVVMNGVLEWMGLADEEEDPLSLQRRALKNVFNLLKKGGRLYLGIENSHGFKYLLGEPDDHTGVKNITFLSREDADKLMREITGRPYRTYTHSYSGYAGLLKEAGFNKVDFYNPIPDYKIMTAFVPLSEGMAYKYYLENLLPDSEPGSLRQNVKNLELEALASGNLRDRVSSYSMVAEKI